MLKGIMAFGGGETRGPEIRIHERVRDWALRKMGFDEIRNHLLQGMSGGIKSFLELFKKMGELQLLRLLIHLRVPQVEGEVRMRNAERIKRGREGWLVCLFSWGRRRVCVWERVGVGLGFNTIHTFGLVWVWTCSYIFDSVVSQILPPFVCVLFTLTLVYLHFALLL